MSCPRRFLLVRYHAEDLAPKSAPSGCRHRSAEASEAEVIRAHLAECQPCRCFVRELERRRRKFLERHPADQVVPEILAEADRREKSWWWRVRMWWWIRRSD